MARQEISRFLHQTVGKGIARIKENLHAPKLAQIEEREVTVAKIPIYIDQLAGADPKKISSFYGPIRDQAAAKKFGAKNLGEFSFWAWRACGIVALQMALTTEFPFLSNKTTMDLINEGLELNGYKREGDTGWRHQALVQLAHKHGLPAQIKKFTPLSEIALEISNGNYVLISVQSQTGGHFLLGFKAHLEQNGKLSGITVHDPNSFQGSGEAKFFSTEQLSRMSTRRVIVIAPSLSATLISQQEEERKRIGSATQIEQNWWQTKIISDSEGAIRAKQLVLVPDQGKNYRLIKRIVKGQEPNLVRSEVAKLLVAVQQRWQQKTEEQNILTENIRLAVTSLYRDHRLQNFLVTTTSLAIAGFSSHQAGAAIDFDPNGYYQGTKAQPINRQSPGFNPLYTRTLKQVLLELKEQGICNFVAEKNYRLKQNGEIEEYEACYHVCVDPEAF